MTNNTLERARQYIAHGLEQEKLQIKHLEEFRKQDFQDIENIDLMLSIKKQWLNEQRY